MTNNFTYVDVLKMLSILILLAIPPWVVMRKYIKNYINKYLHITLFIVYIGATIFAQNVMPFIVVLISLYFIKRTKEENQISYCFRTLGDKKLGIILNALVFKFAITLINLWFIYFLMSKGIKVQEQEIGRILINAGWLKVLILSFMTVIIAPILEEFVFRHILYRNFSKKIGKPVSSILTSVLFAMLHFNLAGSISFFAVGVYNCYLYEKHGYRASVLNHFIFNFVSTLFIVLAKALNLKVIS